LVEWRCAGDSDVHVDVSGEKWCYFSMRAPRKLDIRTSIERGFQGDGNDNDNVRLVIVNSDW